MPQEAATTTATATAAASCANRIPDREPGDH